jgi:NAD+ kinase
VKGVAVYANPTKPDAVAAVRDLVPWLERSGLVPVVHAEVASLAGFPHLAAAEPAWPGEVDFAVALGGDGTMLSAAKSLAPAGIPVLGVNLGRMGFLTAIEAGEMYSVLPQVIAGDYVVEERMMLEAAISGPGGVKRSFLALNDAVLTRRPFARIVHLRTFVGGTLVASYRADGLIVATPTGSTAYSLSAGGPIVGPSLEVLLVTPICPHSFYARAVVVSTKETVRIVPAREDRDVALTIDGQEGCTLEAGDEVVCRRAKVVARFIRRRDWSFYRVLRAKLTEAAEVE